MSYKSISFEERILIEKYVIQGKNITQIAIYLNRSKSTISRELKRNAYYQCYYVSDWADFKSSMRKTMPRIKYKTENSAIKNKILKMLERKYSPDAMVGRSNILKDPINISNESIYQILYRDKRKGGSMWKMHPRKRKKHKNRLLNEDGRDKIADFISILDRPS